MLREPQSTEPSFGKKTKLHIILDQQTRWGSTYRMIERLLVLKPVIEGMAIDNNLTDLQWTELDSLKSLLTPFQNSTIKLQREDLTPGEFLAEWRYLRSYLASKSSLISDGIKNSMARREALFLQNPTFIAAVYIDPKYRILLRDQLSCARQAFCDLVIRVSGLGLETEDANYEDASPVLSLGSQNDSFEIKSMNDFEKMLDNEQKEADQSRSTGSLPREITPREKFVQEFSETISIKIEKIDRHSKLKVLDAIQEYPEIVRETALVLTALPPTQVSVERLFSALKLLKSDLRTNLKEDVLEAMLFLRTNRFSGSN